MNDLRMLNGNHQQLATGLSPQAKKKTKLCE